MAAHACPSSIHKQIFHVPTHESQGGWGLAIMAANSIHPHRQLNDNELHCMALNISCYGESQQHTKLRASVKCHYNKHLCCMQIVLIFLTHSSVHVENYTLMDTKRFAQNDLRSHLPKLWYTGCFMILRVNICIPYHTVSVPHETHRRHMHQQVSPKYNRNYGMKVWTGKMVTKLYFTHRQFLVGDGLPQIWSCLPFW